MLRCLIVGVTLVVLGACASAPVVEARPELQFVDLQSFDAQLAASLQSPLSRVEVTFYDRVTPSQLPERLQRWLSAVQSGGGKVAVNGPPTSVAAKSPLLLIGAISALWSAHKTVSEAGQEAELRAARQFNAELHLKQDERGDVAISRVVFVRRGS